MENLYVAYAKRLMLMDRKIPETLCKIRDIAARRFGVTNVSLECGFDSYDYGDYIYTIDNEIISALRRHWYYQKLIKISRNALKELCPEFWTKFAIVIHIPDRVVANEENKKIKIKDLFVRIPLCPNGKLAGKFQYMRTTFTQEQYAAGYIHSHCTRLDRSTIRSWHSVCTGHGQDTPINGTIERLMTNKFDPLTWECFFWELEKATGSESLTGGPYIRMSYVESPLEKITTLPMPRPLSVVIADAKRCGFLKDYIKSGLFNIAYLNGRVTIAESFASWLVAFSEFFFKWEEEHTAYMRLPTSTYIVFNDTLYRKKANTNAASYREAGTPVLKFKGKEFNLTITKEENDSTNEKKLITPEIGFVFLNTILNIINTKLAYCEYEERAKIPERKRREVANVYYEANFPNTRAENIKFF